MVKFNPLGLASAALFGLTLESSLAFAPQSCTNGFVTTKFSTATKLSLASKSHPEFKIVGEDDEDDEPRPSGQPSPDLLVVSKPEEVETPTAANTPKKNKPEYGALSPGTVVQVQVGDVSLARKAWKKRRRTGSPLLVPCSILNVDRQSMVRWNLVYLLEKFGESQKDGVQISTAQLSKRYRTFLKSSLQNQADALGYESNHDMIVALLNKKAQESYGVRLVEDKEGELCLKAPISRFKAQKRAAGTPVLQFRKHRKGEHGDWETMTHTGHIRAKKVTGEEVSYGFLPLSAALRVSQKDDLDSGRVEEGNIHPAVVYDYDPAGDGGSPLLTLSLNPRGLREGLKIKPDKKYTPIEHPEHLFEELSVGDGPYRARVVQLVPGKALVDFEVGRKVSSEGMVKVLGGLRFQDSVEIVDDSTTGIAPSFVDESFGAIDDVLGEFDEDYDDDDDDGPSLVEDLLSLRDEDSFEEGTFEDGEEEEDISDLFSTNADGSLSYTDPDSGESLVIENDDEDYLEMLNVQNLINSSKERMAKGFQKVEPVEPPKVIVPAAAPATPSEPRLQSKRLRVGDFVDVYIRSVSKQSSQFMVSTNPSVKGRSAKEIKKEGDAKKKLKRLKDSLGGSLKRIWDLEGQECTGVVKATSSTGNWVYVKPELNGLPVGIAALDEGAAALVVGDSVKVQISGVDEQKGQLSMKYIGKLSP
mmetsp:Transcript_5788/g.8723  ORF Transcript_5788/g.8723 Transcript_5788/m.8723 type:complete len:700 (+) Transcript_5788:130-2229(+)|eukprot:CAMPEP_0117012934 /NCGR_PEP_ID=MMETSP0472-20121206/10769_1 /TAXON_ID=693140 ORGANISM="Tiarina fusus, Strain LIS" /NCGR_SAMPLE_ID=MMETSP0472 /ASSEMBLY_ACC=CAM_ASM_000603 /LENGTH=699 /DNA_ID=CAMNT_0004716109 /DNA_START=104 /DNA_END=2203 /DNA_ORIENTATION=-